MKDNIKPLRRLHNICPKRCNSLTVPLVHFSNLTCKIPAASWLLQLTSFTGEVGKGVYNSKRIIWAIALLLMFLFPAKGWTQATKTFTVNTLGDASDPNAGEIGDDGVCDTDPTTPGDQCTCRAAIENQNGNRNLGTNEIKFAIPNAPGSGSILIMVGSTGLGPLPPVLGSVIINAKNEQDGRRIELDGSMAGSNAIGLRLLGGPCQVSFFIINRFSSHGIFISGTPPPGDGGNVIKGNYIGTDATGKISKGNGGDGVFIDNTGNDTIGGTTFDDINIISGNKGYGVVIHGADPQVDFLPNGARNNMVKGNFIGLDVDGNLVLPNEKGGVLDDNAPNNRIGDSTNTNAANKIAGVNNGITVQGSLSEGVGIEGNFIGKDSTGVKFAAGIFTRSGKALSITGNFLTNIDQVGMDIFLDANGGYNILKNSINGSVLTGAKFTFGPGRVVDINYQNNIHKSNGTGLVIDESINSTINWLVTGDELKNGGMGGNVTFRASGKKQFEKNHWEANAGVGLKYAFDLGAGVNAQFLLDGDVSIHNGLQGYDGDVKVATQAVFTYSMLDLIGSQNGKDGYRLALKATAGASSDVTIGGKSDLSFNAGFGFAILGDKSSIDLFKINVEKISGRKNLDGAVYIFDAKIPFSLTGNEITDNTGPGITLDGESFAHIDSNTITGNGTAILIKDLATARINNNSISNNGKGIALAGTGTGILVTDNSIFNNTIGIDLGDDGVTANDAGDANSGPNNLQNFPILTAASSAGGNTNIVGSLNSTPNSNFRIEFFSNNTCSPSGFGEGQTFLGFQQVSTDANGNAAFSVTLPGVTVSAGSAITATATDSGNSTSEFGPCFLNGSPQLADLELTKQEDKTQVTIGSQVTYTLTLSNKGPAEATGITVKDILPAGISFNNATASTGSYDNNSGVWSVDSLTSGNQETLTITGTTTQAGTIVNTAEVIASNQPDPDSSPGNGVATEDDQSNVSLDVQQNMADLELIKTANKTSLTVGETVTFTLTLSNKGPAEATGITVTDILPAGISFNSANASTGSYDNSSGIWSVNALNSGNQETLTITGTATLAGTIINTAEVTASDQPDPDSSPGNGVATEDDQSSISVQVANAAGVEAQIIQLINQVNNLVQQGELTVRQGRILNGLLNISSDLYKRGFKQAAVFTLRVFIFSVRILVRTHQLSGEEGQNLILAAQNVIQLIESEQQLVQNRGDNTIALKNNTEDKPGDYKLYPNYPNPFNNSTVISFELPKESKTRLTIYNMEGRLITQLADRTMPAGKHSITWQPEHLSAGIYLLRFQAGNFSKTQRMVMIK